MKQSDNSLPPGPRRKFLNLFWSIAGLLAFLELAWLTGSVFKARNTGVQTTASTLLDAARVDELKPGEVKAVPQGGFYLCRLEDGSYLALSRTCTHLGCTVPWDEKRREFICPCHGSTFDIRGINLTPPALRPLDYYPARIENGIVRIDHAIPVRRDSYEPNQAVTIA